jgi:hypothetical protein
VLIAASKISMLYPVMFLGSVASTNSLKPYFSGTAIFRCGPWQFSLTFLVQPFLFPVFRLRKVILSLPSLNPNSRWPPEFVKGSSIQKVHEVGEMLEKEITGV